MSTRRFVPFLAALAAWVVSVTVLSPSSPRGEDRLASGSLASPSAARAELTAGDDLTIYFTAETHGNLEPCACPQNRLGGLARRVGFLNRSGESAGPVLRLDVGGFLPLDQVPLRDDAAVATRFVRLLLRGLERSGYDAIALDRGSRSFLGKVAPAEAKRLDQAFLDANPVGSPRLMRWGPTGIAVLAIDASVRDTVAVLAADDARRAARELSSSGAQPLLIVLARADAIEGQRVAQLTDADLVLLSRGARPRQAWEIEGSYLAGCGIDGKQVGEIHVRRNAGRFVIEGFALHPMDESVVPDAPTNGEVARIMTEDGVSLRASVLTSE